MQATNSFKTIINDHLQGLAAKDQLFAESLKKPNKNIDDCTTYILNEVKKSGKNGFADDEIFNMAVHYYDEDVIEVGKPVSGKVVVNHTVELSRADKEEAHRQALERAIALEQQRLAKKTIKKSPPTDLQPSLF